MVGAASDKDRPVNDADSLVGAGLIDYWADSMRKGGDSYVMGPRRFDGLQWGMVYCDQKGEYVRASECAAVKYGKSEFRRDRCQGCRGAYIFETLD